MSIFDYPRINFAGELRLNPGTANNDDYAQPGLTQRLMPSAFGPRYAQHAMGLMDTRSASALRWGMDDATYVEWIQAPRVFDTPSGKPGTTIPAEWNYYGDMSSTPVNIKVVGVQPSPGELLTEPSDDALGKVLGATLDFYGNITDINPEGSPPATQFFVDNLSLKGAEKTWIEGVDTSKGSGLWINFFRNANAVADDGAGTCIHQVITPMDGGSIDLPGFEGADGVVMRSYIYLPLLPPTMDAHALPDGVTLDDVLVDHYRNRKTNPKTMQIVGTLAPWHKGEPIAMPPGRQLISRKTNIDTAPMKRNNGSGHLALAPATASRDGDRLSVDFSGSFPEQLDPLTRANPKFDFGPVVLMARLGDELAEIGQVDYRDVTAGNHVGWIFDFDLAAATEARTLLDNGGRLALIGAEQGTVLDEVDYYIVTDHLTAYCEQDGPDDRFVCQGDEEPIFVRVFHRGAELTAAECPPINMWQYRSAPIQAPGDAVKRESIAPHEPINVDTAEPGARLLTFRVDGETNPAANEFPPLGYAEFAYPPAFPVTWAPAISVRILPNYDYSGYYDLTDDGPVGNDSLTWAFVYDEVLRTYDLLFPTMKNKIDLGDQQAMIRFAPYVLKAVSKEYWKSVRYMPPTRDLSDTKRTLLQAWCRKAMRATAAASGNEPEGIC